MNGVTRKAISLWQPWASLWAAGIKTNETRSWPTRYRGPLLVHAALVRDPDGALLWQELWEQIPELLSDLKLPVGFVALPFGAIVGEVYLCDCTPTELVATDWLEGRVGNYSPGRFAWRADSGQLLDPIPCKGRQGFWNIESSAPLPAKTS